jgi:Uma2 family endonuclease
MPALSSVSVEQYLHSSYDPDCDYVDGRIEERNLGEVDHSWLQKELILFFAQNRKRWGIEVIPEVRVQVGETRFRVPDLCIILGRGKPQERILTRPPFLCIEILSPEDRLARVQERIEDYLKMGVSYVWVLDPAAKRAYAATAESGFHEVKGNILRTGNPVLELPLDEIFGQ